VSSTILVGLLFNTINHGFQHILCEARKPSSGGSNVSSRRSSVGTNSRRPPSNSRPSARRKANVVQDEYDDVTEDESDLYDMSDVHSDGDDVVSDRQAYDQDIYDGYDDDEDSYDDFEKDRERPKRSTRRTAPSRGAPAPRSSRSRQTSTRASPRSSSRKVVSRQKQRPPASAFSRGLTALRHSIPDPHSLKDSAISSISSAKETTTRISSSLYREVKTLSSSELEQAFLKATVPNDSPAKEKHVERLVMITYQVSAGYNIFEVILRKLWSKMMESDWRTKIKAVYVLHRFGTDGSPQQQMALKTMLREMRRTKDPKRKMKYFNTKHLLEGDTNPANIAFRSFLARYAHYVLLRVQCFGGMFSEIAPPAQKPSSTKSSSSKSQTSSTSEKPITSTRLKKECLDAAQVVLKAGLACDLKPNEECENTVAAMERVVSDMIGLTTAVAAALNSALDDTKDDSVDKSLIKLWCEFYSQELLPQTKAMIKNATPTLDAFGIFLPSRMATSVSQELIQKGLTYVAPTNTSHLEIAGEDKKGLQEEQGQGLPEEKEREEEEDDVEESTDSIKTDNAAKTHDDEMDENETVYEVDAEYDEYEYDDEYYDAEF